jgi:hypothetical protein
MLCPTILALAAVQVVDVAHVVPTWQGYFLSASVCTGVSPPVKSLRLSLKTFSCDTNLVLELEHEYD